MCTHFHLLDLLTERGTVTGTVLSGDADLLSAYIAINIVFLIARVIGTVVRLVILAVFCWRWTVGCRGRKIYVTMHIFECVLGGARTISLSEALGSIDREREHASCGRA